MAFEAHQHQISFLLGKMIYTIPRNQRKYVWGIDNWKNLLEDLDFLQDTGKFHFIGSIVLNKLPNTQNDAVEHFEIIDGQQRITTIILILIVIAQIFKERGENALFQGLLQYIQTTNINNDTQSTLQSDVHSCIMTMVSQVSNPSTLCDDFQSLVTYCITNKQQDGIIQNCLQYFYDNLRVRETEKIISFRNALISANYVNITTTDEDAYTVFEILNARGMDLEEHELLKNFILRYTLPVNHIDIARNEWKEEIENRLGKHITNFLKHYVSHKFGISGEKRHRAIYDAIKKQTNISDVNLLFSDLKLKAKYYQKIVCAVPNLEEVTETDRILKFMLAKRSYLFRPIFLSLFHQEELGRISAETMTKAFKCIQYFFICYNLISRETSNKISEGIQKYASLLENDFSVDTLTAFFKHLKDRMPSKAEFRNNFKLLGYSNHCDFYHDNKNKQRVEMALGILEQIKSGLYDIPSFTIEHILPDSQNRENSQIGNLMPLEPNLNARCEDKGLADKILIYEDSNFRTARNIAKRYHGKEASFSINSRGNAMADEIYDTFEQIMNSLS